MANPNIIGVTSILGKTAVMAVPNATTPLVSNALASNTVVKINTLIAGNITGSVQTISVELVRGGSNYNIAQTVSVPANSTIVVLTKDTTIYLEEGDTLNVFAGTVSALEAVCSYEIIS